MTNSSLWSTQTSVHRAQNILFDENYNITCIIDWSLCSTVPLATLITHPPLPSRSYEVEAAEREAFEQAFEEEQRKANSTGDLMPLLRSSQLRRVFNRFLHKDGRVDDWSRFQKLFESKYGSVDMREYFKQRKNDLLSTSKIHSIERA